MDFEDEIIARHRVWMIREERVLERGDRTRPIGDVSLIGARIRRNRDQRVPVVRGVHRELL